MYGSHSVVFHTRTKKSFYLQFLSSCGENCGHFYLHIPGIIISRIWPWYFSAMSDLYDFGEEEKVQDGLEKYLLQVYLNQEMSGLACLMNTVR